MRIAKIPLDFVDDCFKSALPKTAVDDSPGASLLGLTTTVGAVLLGNAASGNSKADVCGWRFRVPHDWAEGQSLVLRARVKKATTLSTVSDKVSATATRAVGDGTVGANLVAGAAAGQQVTIAYADYDFIITSTTIKRGDLLYGTLTLTANDTGGAVNTAMSCSMLTVLYAKPTAV